MAIEYAQHICPSCGRATALTAYAPEPSVCLPCQQVYGLAPVAPPRSDPVPDDPVWGIPVALGVWLAAVAALIAAEAGAAAYLFYMGWQGVAAPVGSALFEDPSFSFVRILSSGVAHLLTFALAFAVVTDGGRYPFLKSLGWGWPRRIGLKQTVLIAVALQLFSAVVALSIHGPESTPFSRLLESSEVTKIAVGLFAVVTAPLVEEIVYRGVLYPALARPFGRPAAILLVSGLFLLVHSSQYAGALVIMLPLGLLSLTLTALRAYTGSLLPSYVLHLLFNGITVFFMFLPGVGGRA